MPAPRCFLWSALSIFLVWFLGFSPVAEVRCSGGRLSVGVSLGEGPSLALRLWGLCRRPPSPGHFSWASGSSSADWEPGQWLRQQGGCVLACRPHPRTRGCTLRLSATAPARPGSFPPSTPGSLEDDRVSERPSTGSLSLPLPSKQGAPQQPPHLHSPHQPIQASYKWGMGDSRWEIQQLVWPLWPCRSRLQGSRVPNANGTLCWIEEEEGTLWGLERGGVTSVTPPPCSGDSDSTSSRPLVL